MRLLLLFLVAAAASSTAADSSSSVVMESAQREVQLISQVTGIVQKLTFKNTGKAAVQSVDLCVGASFAEHESFLEVTQGKGSDGDPLKVSPSQLQGIPGNVSCISVELESPIAPKATSLVEVETSYTRLLQPFPAAIFQNEPQRVLYHDNHYILSPYQILDQTTKVKTPNKRVESFTKEEPTAQTGSTLKYGPYKDLAPFSVSPMRLHFENNAPFAVATSLVREVEISHWGNVYVEEAYVIKHIGAKTRGEWSRLELMRDPQKYGQAAVRGFLANLPPNAHTIYYRDVIGNISTSAVRRQITSTEVVLTPRYPLFGGWQVEFVFGYSLPLNEVVYQGADGTLKAVSLFGTPLAGLIVDDITNKVVLPEGSKVTGVGAPFDVDVSHDKKFTYLDTAGRPVVLVHKRNIGREHNQPFSVDYTFSSISLLQEPLLLVAAFALLFALTIAYNRCDLTITRDAKWQASQGKALAAHLVERIAAVIAQREREVAEATDGPAMQVDVKAVQSRLKASEEKLKQLCGELEAVAGPGHSGRVRALLEKERAVQAKAVQLVTRKSQYLKEGASPEVANAKAAQEAKEVAGLKQEASALRDSLQNS